MFCRLLDSTHQERDPVDMCQMICEGSFGRLVSAGAIKSYAMLTIAVSRHLFSSSSASWRSF